MAIKDWFGGWGGEPTTAWLDEQRRRMVESQIRARGVRDPRVLDAMARVPRHVFVPAQLEREAYEDRPLAIGHDQTISQPYIVAFMTELCAIRPDSKVLEIGTGSGYQSAILAQLADQVYTIERIEPLHEQALRVLNQQGYRNIHFRLGDGYAGWPEEAPFDAIMVTAAPPAVPDALRHQLANGGQLVVPVGGDHQDLVVVTRHGKEWSERTVLPVRFVPMVAGVAQLS